MVQPWLENGFRAVTIDLQAAEPADNLHTHIRCDVRRITLATFMQHMPLAAVFAFPPCTNLAVSGARWFKDKGLKGLIDGLEIVEACRFLCENSEVPWMLENPVSTLSTYWRKPDHIFHPHQFTSFELGDNYTKKTCLWTGGGFVMPASAAAKDLGEPDNRIHFASPSDERANFRSATPMGFARAVFHANALKMAEVS
jgi:hypothetical protein